ncbi:hypothetical protein OG455_20170 [Kitasatospora sp. NBC_01287]|uniref:FtsX-like permease family protein n=1 Tax=Kitasatospora sp. NBC_01287 TaxID=2903573 RepID=UPI00225572A1|nr:FtsX-like permease family protein [Kitasatospora sp. NBC_01287]MCX4747805.1 hypothetical protein [Kitasatospora sp. NBC_01287]
MIRFGLRLTLAAGRESVARLVIVAAAVALGVGMLLGTLAAINATNTQNGRNSWLDSGAVADSGAAPAAGTQPLWWLIRADRFQDRTIGRVDVAATGPDSPLPPGIPKLPGPGQYYASPAMAKLLSGTPADQLADRYPGQRIGTIGSVALPAPDSLIIVIGHTPGELSADPEARQITSIMTKPPSECASCPVGTNANGMDLILSVVAAALIFPVVILIGTATRLAATRREQRFAAMRLVGATPRQISVVSAVESTVAAVAGTVAGFGLFFLLRPLLATVDLTTARFFTSDVALNLNDVLAVALGVPVAAAVAARIALRRVRISPLGVTRRATPRPPRIYRVLPLALGVLELSYFIGRRPHTSAGQVRAFVPGILLILGGLVLAGPWLTMVGSRLMARRTGRPAVLVAGRRLADDPKAGFRAVSGLVLALCVTSGAVGVIDALTAERGVPQGSTSVRDVLVGSYFHGWTPAGQPVDPESPLPDPALAALRAIPGVTGVTVVHTDPLGTSDPVVLPPAKGSLAKGPPPPGALVDCAQLATTPAFGVCGPGAEAATITPFLGSIGLNRDEIWPAHWPTATISAQQVDRLPVQLVVVATDGSLPAVERARTLLASSYPTERLPETIGEDRSDMSAELRGYQQLADVVILISLPIAGCSLAVAVAGGLSDRKRPFSLLRLTGVRLAVLRRVVLLESALPLLVVAVVAIGMGFVAAQLFLQAQYGYSVRAPDLSYYLLVLLGLAASLGVIGSTLPLLERITGPETARNE